MSQDLLASKVVVVEEEPRVRGIASAPTSVAGAVGVTEQGPFNQAVLCTSFDEYQATFGGFTADADVALAAKGFFENGGERLWVSRVGAESSAASAEFTLTGEPDALPATVTSTVAPPYAIENGDQINFEAGVSPDNYPFTLTFNATAAGVITLSAPYALSDGQTLELRVDGQLHTATFTSGQFADIGAATVEELSAAITADIPEVQCSEAFGGIFIQTVSGGLDSHLEFVGGDALSVLGIEPGSIFDGGGNVHDPNAMTVDDIVRALAQSGYDTVLDVEDVGTGIKFSTIVTGSSARVRVTGGAAATIMGFDSDAHDGVPGTEATVPVLQFEAIEPGLDGNRLSILIDPPGGYDLRLFSVNVLQDSNYIETFSNVSRDPLNERFIETVMNDSSSGSQYVRVTNVPNFPRIHPTIFESQPLSGGSGGSPTDASFVGDEATRTGLHALDVVQDLSLLLVPGRATAAVHNAMLAYCDVYRDGSVFAVLDPPLGITAADMVTYVTTTASLENASERAAIYWPRVKVLNPDKTVFGSDSQIVVPPSGIIAGMYARNDASRPGGVYRSPAGIEAGRLFGVVGFETDETFDERKRDLVYPHRINPLTTESGLPRYADGSRTLKGDGNFPSISARRGAMFIEQSLKEGLAFARHKSNTPDLRAQVRRTITAFMITQMNNGAFRSREPAKAFFVDVSDQLNSPSVVADGKLVARVGIATNNPAEFLVLEISQDTRAIEAELAGG